MPQNFSAVDWGSHNLIAYGCQGYLVVVDPSSVRVLQTLDFHGSAAVSCVRWCPEGVLSPAAAWSYYSSGSSAAAAAGLSPAGPASSLSASSPADGGSTASASLREMKALLSAAAPSSSTSVRSVLASGDVSGTILVTDVVRADVLVTFAEEGLGPVHDLQWLPDDPSVLLSLHAPSQIFLWNMESKQMVGRFRIDEAGASLRVAFDPFDPARLCIASTSGSIFFAEGVTRAGCREVVPRLRVQTVAPGAEAGRSLRALFSPAARRILFVMLEREILVYDTAIDDVVGRVALERQRPGLIQIFLCKTYPELLYCLHLDGSISVLKKTPGFQWSYQVLCIADMPRGYAGPKGRRELVAMALCPRSEESIVSITADGTLSISRLLAPPAAPKPQMMVTSVLEGVVASVTRLAVCPIVGAQNDHRIAQSSADGVVQVVHLQDMVTKRFRVGDAPLTALEWIDSQSLLVSVISNDRSGSRNRVIALDVMSGRQWSLRNAPEGEEAPIEAVYLSPARQYFAVHLRDRPVELWDLLRNCLLAVFPQQATAACWEPTPEAAAAVTAAAAAMPATAIGASPFMPRRAGRRSEGAGSRVRERLVMAVADGGYIAYTVTNGEITSARLDVPSSPSRISSMAFKGSVMVSADVHGNLLRYDFGEEVSRPIVYTTSRGAIRKVVFSPGRSLQMMVHFGDGDFGIWNLEHGHRVATSAYLRSKNLDTLDVQWISAVNPVAALSDGSVRVLDSRLTVAHSPIERPLRGPVTSPILFSLRDSERVRVILQHGPRMRVPEALRPSDAPPAPALLDFEEDNEPETAAADSGAGSLRLVDAFARFADLVALLDPAVIQRSEDTEALSTRCMLTAVFFGLDLEEQFWTLAKYALETLPVVLAQSAAVAAAASAAGLVGPGSPVVVARRGAPGGGGATGGASSAAGGDGKEASTAMEAVDAGPRPVTPPLAMPTNSRAVGQVPAYMDILLDQQRIRAYESQRADMLEALSRDAGKRRVMADLQTILGKRAHAADVQLSTPSDDPRFLLDQYRACVIGASVSPELFGQTARLAASNMIASGFVDDGVQMLVLIGKGKEACHYLQALDRWRDAAWLAKMSLEPHDAAVVLKRWAKELIQKDQRMRAVHVLLSLADVRGALYLLHEMGELGWAALLLEALEQARLLAVLGDAAAARASAEEMAHDLAHLCLREPPRAFEQLVAAIWLRYGDLLAALGMPELALYYWAKCGPDGLERIALVPPD